MNDSKDITPPAPPYVAVPLAQDVRPRGGASAESDASTGWPKDPGYDIEGVLGRGGMAVVYLALQVNLKRRVALKMILHGTHAGEHELA